MGNAAAGRRCIVVMGSVTWDEVMWMSDKGVTDLGFAGSICWLIFPYL